MGTRADFYIGPPSHTAWIGSIAYDGYRIHDLDENDLLAMDIATAPTPDAYSEAV